MTSEIEKEIGMTLAEFQVMTREQRNEKALTLTQEQIKKFNELTRKNSDEQTWKQRKDGTYPFDVEQRADILKEIAEKPIDEYAIMTFGMMFEAYIQTYPVNENMSGDGTQALGAYMGILNFELLDRAIDEILEVAFDKFGFMHEWICTFDYLSPTFGMISSWMRRKMPEFDC